MDKESLAGRYTRVRQFTEKLCEPLATEDYVVQTIEDVSPPKWHLGHTTWFFEQVILEKFTKSYVRYHPGYYFIFNSYYESYGDRVQRVKRGDLSRPTVDEVKKYRREIDTRILKLFESASDKTRPELEERVEIGLNHEQQHQELLLTDLKHNLCHNPLFPAYISHNGLPEGMGQKLPEMRLISVEGGLVEIGADRDGFAYDNERPRHKTFVGNFMLGNRLVTCGEFLKFIEDGGYENPLLWLSDGWYAVQGNRWKAPLYWHHTDEGWKTMTLTGLWPLNPNEPVCHVSHYEAAAFAQWAGKRLPTEFEWEVAVQKANPSLENGTFVEDNTWHPVPLLPKAANADTDIYQLFGDVWEWTSSAYLPYPGFKPVPGALGEYNGKFMNNQMVLRGGSCATSRSHIRPTYRNFFQSDKRWQFSGFRLADDA